MFTRCRRACLGFADRRGGLSRLSFIRRVPVRQATLHDHISTKSEVDILQHKVSDGTAPVTAFLLGDVTTTIRALVVIVEVANLATASTQAAAWPCFE
jgi:hypothetical protein